MRRVLTAGALTLLATCTGTALPMSAYGQPADDSEDGQITVTPGDQLGWNAPPKVRMDAEYGKRRTGSGPGSAGYSGASDGSGRPSGGSDGSGSGPTCTVEPPSGGGFTRESTSPEEMQRYFPDMYMGNRGGDESKIFIVRCSDGSIGWVNGDGAGADGGGQPVVQLPSPAELAERARQQLQLPLPTPGMSPKVRLSDGRDATLVRENTWLWTDPGAWKSRSERVQVGPVWAEVTARPTSMRFTSDLGESVSCDGPGTPYERRFGLHAASPDCGLRFKRASDSRPDGETTAEYAITWSVSWTGSTGGGASEGGELPDMIAWTSESFVVAEAQSLRAH